MSFSNMSKSKVKVLSVAIALSQTLAFAPLSVFAADGTVRLAGQVVITNRSAAGGMTADKRTEAIQRNLDNALVAAKNRTPQAVDIVYVKGLPVITLDGYQIATVDDANAKAAGTTPTLLAKTWADGIRHVLVDTGSVESYIAQLSGDYRASAPQAAAAPQQPQQPSYQQASYPPQTSYPQQGSYAPPTNYAATPNYPNPAMRQGRVIYAPAGLTMNTILSTSISTQVAQSGDTIQANVAEPVNLGEGTIPAGSVLIGQITEAKSGGFFGRSGMLGIKFNRLRTPDGIETPISAHIVGGIGKYADIGGDQSDIVKGETMKTKLGQAAIRTAVGAGAGAALGTAVGAIAGRSGRATGRGAWSGTAIGGGLGAVQSVTMRKGNDVKILSGQRMQVQLDAPVSISGGGVPPYTGAF
ncbi:MAG: hypothetical protein K2Y22_11665 [Candidatus Obscuribacterales bacterium]|nr:hypothetical protein [Candidatus Obscuribacterales bacterium]